MKIKRYKIWKYLKCLNNHVNLDIIEKKIYTLYKTKVNNEYKENTIEFIDYNGRLEFIAHFGVSNKIIFTKIYIDERTTKIFKFLTLGKCRIYIYAEDIIVNGISIIKNKKPEIKIYDS